MERKFEFEVANDNTYSFDSRNEGRDDNKNAQDSIHDQRESFDREHNLSGLSEEEKRRMHEGYSKMGKMGGDKRAEELGSEGYKDMGHMGGVTRAEQMAKKDQSKKDEE